MATYQLIRFTNRFGEVILLDVDHTGQVSVSRDGTIVNSNAFNVSDKALDAEELPDGSIIAVYGETGVLTTKTSKDGGETWT